MTILTDEADVCRMREAGRIIREIFALMETRVRAGVSTAELDKEAEKVILRSGSEPAFKGYKGYPATICASVNEVVVHGIPSETIVLAGGDIIAVDVGVKKDGFYADGARTYKVGAVTEEAQRLMDVTEKSLEEGIRKAVAGNRLSDISNAIQLCIEDAGYEEVRAFVGHGIGRELHEPPEVPNWGEKGRGPKLKEGLVLAIEPMVNAGTRKINILDDGWTAVTIDGKLSAHFENTVIIGKQKAEIIT